jgi:hypothetical protein
MTLVQILKAKAEAHRFIHRANKAISRLGGDAMAEITGCPETAACRRASMDLTRALAEMRKPR